MQSILRVVSLVLPEAEHRHCARHIFANWHKSYRGEEMKLLFWRCAKAYNEADFNDAIQDMNKVNPNAVDDFKKRNPKVFCKAFVKTSSKCDVILSNMAETFNCYIIHARAKHLCDMLEDIRSMLMQRLVVKRAEAEKWTTNICPRVQARLDKEKSEASNCCVIPSTLTRFQVSYYYDNLEVDLDNKTCTCRKWDVSGIPCRHVIACLFYLHKEPEDYVDVCYTKEAYVRAYSGSINPCTGERHWPKVDLALDPPPIKIGPGRPRKNRFKSPFEDPKRPGKLTKHGQLKSCNVCKSTTHNKRKCPKKDKHIELNNQPSKRQRGRPRKNIDVEQVAATTTPNHHNASAQPTAIGRGGKTLRVGQGSRGGASRRGGFSQNVAVSGGIQILKS